MDHHEEPPRVQGTEPVDAHIGRDTVPPAKLEEIVYDLVGRAIAGTRDS